MGTNNLPEATDGTAIPATDHNAIVTALEGDLVPRNTSGVPETEGGDLGTSTYQFKNARIVSGYWTVGDIKMHHSYNGGAPIGQGWMLCDGRQITSAAYDAEHAAGDWAEYVVSSTLLNKYLPNLTNRYPVGKATTTQDGSIAITPVGNTTHLANIDHTHAIGPHNHQWYDSLAGTTVLDKTWDSSGFAQDLPSGTVKTAAYGILKYPGDSASAMIGDSYTGFGNLGETASDGGSKNVQPDSIEVQYYMRVI